MLARQNRRPPPRLCLAHLQPYLRCFSAELRRFPELEGTGGAKSSCAERCTVCWDLHEIQPNVQLTNIPDARDSHLPRLMSSIQFVQ